MSVQQTCNEPMWQYPYYYSPQYWHTYSILVRCEVCKGTGKIALREGAYYDTELGKVVYPNKRAKKEIKDCKVCSGQGNIWVYNYYAPRYPSYPITYTTTAATTASNKVNWMQNTSGQDLVPQFKVSSNAFASTISNSGLVKNNRIDLT